MGEHHKHNKGNPYEAYAKIPFVLRYPNKVKAGKIIRKANTTTDFMPTILGLMESSQIKGVEGIDVSVDFESKTKEVIDDRILVRIKIGLLVEVNDTNWFFPL